MKKFSQSFAARLSLRFTFILTTAVLFISVFSLLFVRSLVQKNQMTDLKNAEALLFFTFSQTNENLEKVIPYYFTYILYDDSGEVISTNDPFLPLLPETHGKAVNYFEKDFFFDGDLDILYYAETHEMEGMAVVCAVAMNTENNTSSMIFEKLPKALLLLVLPILLLSYFVAFFIIKKTIKPVVKITKKAQSMTLENLDDLLPLSGHNDEIDELSQTFNELFMRIKADFDRERQFSSDVSHELNTPLTVISGQANLLLRWGKDNPEQLEKSLLSIKDETKSMHAIISNLLQISRIESGRIKPQNVELEIKELFERVREEISAIAPDVKVILECKNERIFTDREMLHQILMVLVSNSVKFSDESCTIRLAAKYDGEKLKIEEYDDGYGIAEDALPHIFERFYRADSSHSRKVSGSGLGLAIARTLSDAIGASISAENVRPHGVHFTISFPNPNPQKYSY